MEGERCYFSEEVKEIGLSWSKISFDDVYVVVFVIDGVSLGGIGVYGRWWVGVVFREFAFLLCGVVRDACILVVRLVII